mmetsp:Transcript_16269/g.24262  ORF Transcript_16269/g.24262 Transcript_16269/m.24262 type:complete len:235 (+) Transcript_16269:52-756(+)
MANYGYGGYGPPQGGSFMPPQGGGYPQSSMHTGLGNVPPAASFGGSFNYQPPQSFANHWYGQYYKQMQHNELAELRKWFMSVDINRDGSITAVELQNLAFGGRPLGFDTALKLVKVFDKDFSGTIDFYEYATLHKFIQSMQKAFAVADSDRNGTLDAREIHGALRASGFMLSFQAVNAMHRKYNKRGYGVSFPDFLSMAADIALLRSKFEWMDKQRQGYVTINLDQLIEMTADL